MPEQFQPPSNPQTPSNPLFKFDLRTKETVQWSAIFNLVAVVVEKIFAYLGWLLVGGVVGQMVAYAPYTRSFALSSLVSDLVWAAIWGAVGGFILAKFWGKIMEINKRWFKGWFNNMFKLLFWPTLVGALIAFVLTAPLMWIVGIGPILFSIVGTILARYIYAKGMTKLIAKHYSF